MLSRPTRVLVSAETLPPLFLAFLLLLSCHVELPSDGLEVQYHLVAEASLAEVHSEVGEIDFGTDPARVHLIYGWSWNERTDQGRTSLVWSREDVSILEIFLGAARDLRVTFRCSPFTFPGAPEQKITFEIDDRPLAEVVLLPGFREYSVSFPEGSLAAGRNRLQVRYQYTRSPLEVGSSSDSRRLAVAWDWLRLEPMPTVDRARLRTDLEAETIFLPYGMEMNFYFDLSGRSAVSLASVEMEGNGTGSLVLLAQQEDSSEKVLATFDRSTGSRAVKLPGTRPRLLRLTLRAFNEELANAAPGGVLLSAPQVRSDRPPPALSKSEPGPEREERPNVVIYMVDTLRADHLGCYDRSPSLSPNIDDFAETSILFEHAIAQSSWTKPAVASVLTGLTPTVHGANHLESRLPAAAETLPELLRAAGYRTAAFSSNPNVSALNGFDQGFDEFVSFPQYTSSDIVTARVETWLEAHVDAPFFLYIHTMDPHAPYDPPEGFRQRFAAEITRTGAGTSEDLENIYAAPRGEERRKLMVDLPPLYEAEVAFNDQSFGELIGVLRERGLFDGALVIFLSDHGEEFGEHGSLGHGNHLYSEVLEVPLIIKPPYGRGGSRVTALAQHLDILPTIASYLTLAPTSNLAGVDLLHLARQEGDLESVGHGLAAFSHMHSYGGEGISVVHGEWKRIEPLNSTFGSRPELYHIAQDPGDRADVIDLHPIRAGYLASLIRRELADLDQALTAERIEIDDATRRSLEALGYLGRPQADPP